MIPLLALGGALLFSAPALAADPPLEILLLSYERDKIVPAYAPRLRSAQEEYSRLNGQTGLERLLKNQLDRASLAEFAAMEPRLSHIPGQFTRDPHILLPEVAGILTNGISWPPDQSTHAETARRLAVTLRMLAAFPQLAEDLRAAALAGRTGAALNQSLEKTRVTAIQLGIPLPEELAAAVRAAAEAREPIPILRWRKFDLPYPSGFAQPQN